MKLHNVEKGFIDARYRLTWRRRIIEDDLINYKCIEYSSELGASRQLDGKGVWRLVIERVFNDRAWSAYARFIPHKERSPKTSRIALRGFSTRSEAIDALYSTIDRLERITIWPTKKGGA